MALPAVLMQAFRPVYLRQGTAEWLQWREGGIGASEAAAVMNISNWDTPVTLWQKKTGRLPPQQENPWMIRGHNLEPAARWLYNQRYDEFMAPLCIESPALPWLKASLDGINFEGSKILEIKCPGVEAHQYALDGVVPPYYYPQLQHQMMVAGPSVRQVDYFSFDGEDGVLVQCPRDETYIEQLFEAESRFWECVLSDQPPVVNEALVAAHNWRRAKQMLEQAKAIEEFSRRGLLEAAKVNPDVPTKLDLMLASVNVATVKGSVDYDALLRAHFIEPTAELLDQFRKPAGTQVKVIASRNNELGPAFGAPEPNQAVRPALPQDKPVLSW